MVNNWLNNILSRLLTGHCKLCGSLNVHNNENIELCPECYKALPWLPVACPRCASPIQTGANNNCLCGQCQTQPPAFDNSLALFHYQTPMDHLIQGLKFHGQLSHARLLGNLMAKYFENKKHNIDCIIPVPLHPKRLRQRGFNQALELARPIAQRLQLNIDTQHCRRLRHTDGQADLSLSKRHSNVHNAFSVSPQLKWQHVVIVDDVMTSGQTVNALANALKQSGVKEVSVWSCCRATIHK